MVEVRNELKLIRFEILNQVIFLNKVRNVKNIQYTLGYDVDIKKHVLTLQLRLNCIDVATNNEVFGYLAEVTNVINEKSRALDRLSLVLYITGCEKEANKFLTEKMPFFSKLTFPSLEKEEYVDAILNELQVQLGWY